MRLSAHLWMARIALACTVCFVASIRLSIADDNWPQFRGQRGSGMGAGNPPVAWDLETGHNIGWSMELPGLAHSSPIVWGTRVYLTNAISRENPQPTLETGWLGGTGDAAPDQGEWDWSVVCLDLQTGQEIWNTVVASGQPKLQRHLKASHANCTPATDGEHIVAFFGSEGLYCLNRDGAVLWKKDLGKLHSGPYNAPELEWGFASSPILYDGKVILQCDCLNTGFVLVLDVEDGRELLRIERSEVATWSTPSVFETDAGPQLVCNGFKQMGGYDLSTGKLLWSLTGGGDVPVPTPILASGRIVITNAHGNKPIFAVEPSARGDLTPDEESSSALPAGLAWWHPRGGSYMPTPIAVGEILYVGDDNGVLTASVSKTGEEVYRRRIGPGVGTFSASPVATKNQLYFCDEKGKVTVVQTGPEYKLLAQNDMAEPIMATPAIAGDRLLIRTTRRLVCIEPKPVSESK